MSFIVATAQLLFNYCSLSFAPLSLILGDSTQLLQVGPCLQPHADLLQVGVSGAGEAGSRSAAISIVSVRLEICGHCLVCDITLAVIVTCTDALSVCDVTLDNRRKNGRRCQQLYVIVHVALRIVVRNYSRSTADSCT